MRRPLVLLTLAAALGAPAAADAAVKKNGSVYARVSEEAVVLGNSAAERSWSRAGFLTTALTDKRGADRTWSRDRRDFTISLPGGAEIGSDSFDVTGVSVEKIRRGGLRVTMRLAAATLTATRTAEAFPGVAGFRMRTTLTSPVPLAFQAATLDEAAVAGAATTIHAFRAGADWREPGWTGPDAQVGDPHAGTWRDSRSATAGGAIEGPAQWLSAERDGRTLFMVMERNDMPSSRARYAGGIESVGVDFTRDIISLGPFEENGHVENPVSGAGRQRTIPAGKPYALEAVFTGFGKGDGDEPWQFHKYLTRHRMAPWKPTITFNSNGTDRDEISTGAKDDMNLEMIERVAPLARRLGVETFILDDGWQNISGDWQPTSAEYPEPRWDGTPTSKFRPRFPDPEFDAVRAALDPMELGLWMSPLNFHNESKTWQAHPEWACHAAGDGLALYNAADPESGSNEAGIAVWSSAALPHIESRIREAIERWQVRYFKFDFIVWLDCAGDGDLYEQHDRFLALVDELRADYPQVVFQIDETNDYRLFPFESALRGPSWFQNGSPTPDRLLHNLWNLAPWIPAYSLGQDVLGGNKLQTHPVPTLMATALASHITFFSDLRNIPEAVLDEARPWLDFYKAHRRDFAQMAYPLLADPLENGWTALQTWNPEAGRGALLAFRQEAEEPAKRIALKNVPDGDYELRAAPDGALVGTATAEELREGIEIALPKRGARVLLVRRTG